MHPISKTPARQSATSIHDHPTEVLSHIFDYLTIREEVNLRRISKAFCNTVDCFRTPPQRTGVVLSNANAQFSVERMLEFLNTIHPDANAAPDPRASYTTYVLPDNINQLFARACQTHYLSAIEYLADYRGPSGQRLDPHQCFFNGCRHGVVRALEHAIDRTDWNPTTHLEYGLYHACKNDHRTVVDWLLNNTAVNPEASHHQALLTACRQGHTRVVDRLLADRRVNPSFLFNEPLRSAALYGHVAVVNRLLRDPRVNAADYSNAPLRVAAKKGHAPVIERLLLDPRVNPAARDNEPLRAAAVFKHRDALKALIPRLLADNHVAPNVDPITVENTAQFLEALFSDSPNFERLTRMISIANLEPALSNNLAFPHGNQNTDTARAIRMEIVDNALLHHQKFADSPNQPQLLPPDWLSTAKRLSQEFARPIIDPVRFNRLMYSPEIDRLIFARTALHPTTNRNIVLLRAIDLAHAPLLEALLLHPRLNPTPHLGSLYAAAQVNTPAIHCLLKNNTNPKEALLAALETAKTMHHTHAQTRLENVLQAGRNRSIHECVVM